MAFVLKHALRVGARFGGGFRPEGWSPTLKLTLVGETPAGAELVWNVQRPDGTAWFEHSVAAPELAAGEMSTVDLARYEDDADIDEAGEVAFTLRLVSELDGVDELLHDGSFRVVALDGEHRYGIDHDWRFGTALLCLDTVAEYDAPPLKVTAYLKGEVDAYQLAAHCFRDGKRFAQASDVVTGSSFTANDGAVLGVEAVAEFDTVRGWNNLTASGWGGDDWHLLDAADGSYQVKFVRDSKVTRVIGFEVSGGRLVAPGPIEFGQWTGPVLFAEASIEGTLDGPVDPATAAPFYGDASTAALPADLDAVYEQRVEPEVPDAPALDDDTQEALQAFYDRAERLINTWGDIEDDVDPIDYQHSLQYEAVLGEMPGFEEKKAAIAGVPDDHPLDICGEQTTVGAVYARVAAFGTRASGG